MADQYTAHDIEVLTGLDPVRKRPGMYTDTSRPNHLAQEVIDNSVDEALAGHAKKIEVHLHTDGSLSVADDGRGMPVDAHPQKNQPGVEVVLTTLHAGGKFSNKQYRFAGGLHGVGVSVVNALSLNLHVRIRRGGKIYEMAFAKGEKTTDLQITGTCGQRNTGTTLRFWPDPNYFDRPTFSTPRLKHLLRAKAVLCPGLQVDFTDEKNTTQDRWHYQDGLRDYLLESTAGLEALPATAFLGTLTDQARAVDWAVQWLPNGGEALEESYVNLIPTPQGGTHVNGLRTGLLEALREFCAFRQLLPRGITLTGDDIWTGCARVLSFKMNDPQFSGQTKERLASREAAGFIAATVKDRFSLWLNQHTADADAIAAHCIRQAEQRARAGKKVARKKPSSGPALPGKLADCTSTDPARTELFLVEGDSAGGSAKQARDREFQAIMPLRGKILNTWELDSATALASREVQDIATALGIDPGSSDLRPLRYGKICILADADSDGLHIATLLCALFLRHFRPMVAAGHVHVAMPPLYRIDAAGQVFYALDEQEKASTLERLQTEKPRAKIGVQRFKGLGEMNPLQLRETTMARDTRRLVQLQIADPPKTDATLDLLLAKKRAPDRKTWLEKRGNLAEV